jgi:hypothetical protein
MVMVCVGVVLSTVIESRLRRGFYILAPRRKLLAKGGVLCATRPTGSNRVKIYQQVSVHCGVIAFFLHGEESARDVATLKRNPDLSGGAFKFRRCLWPRSLISIRRPAFAFQKFVLFPV